MERVMFITFFCPCKKTFHLFYFSSIFHSPSSCRPSPPSFSGNPIITTIHFLAAPSSPHLPATTSCKEFLAVSLINERRHSLMLQSSSQPHLSWEVRVSFSFAGTTRHYRRRRGSTTQPRIRKFDYFLPVTHDTTVGGTTVPHKICSTIHRGTTDLARCHVACGMSCAYSKFFDFFRQGTAASIFWPAWEVERWGDKWVRGGCLNKQLLVCYNKYSKIYPLHLSP